MAEWNVSVSRYAITSPCFSAMQPLPGRAFPFVLQSFIKYLDTCALPLQSDLLKL